MDHALFGWIRDEGSPSLRAHARLATQSTFEVTLARGLEGSVTVSRTDGGVARAMHEVPHYPTRQMREGFSVHPDVKLAWNAGLAARQPQVVADHLPAFARSLSKSEHRAWAVAWVEQCVRYVRAEHLPVYRYLAETYALCDHWFSTALSHTAPNRWAFLQDEHRPRSRAPFLPMGVPKLFQALTTAGVDWTIAVEDGTTVPQSLLVTGFPYLGGKHVIRLSELASWIDPSKKQFVWLESRHAGRVLSNDHRYAHLAHGQNFLRRVLDVVSHDQIWPGTALFLTYDEHGGWYDHVPPPLAPWARGNEAASWGDLYGGRIPALVVSPHVAQGVFSQVVDNTAITAFLRELWGLDTGDDGLSLRHRRGVFDRLWTTTRARRPPPRICQPIVLPTREQLHPSRAADWWAHYRPEATTIPLTHETDRNEREIREAAIAARELGLGSAAVDELDA